MSDWLYTVAANDIGYIPALQEYLDMTIEDKRRIQSYIDRVRLLDRSAQGITPEQEEAAEAAIANREEYNHLTVVRIPHSKCATVTDRLFGQYENLLILSEDGEVNFYGDGAVCIGLQEKFGGWSGGQLPESGFWGGYPNQIEILETTRLMMG